MHQLDQLSELIRAFLLPTRKVDEKQKKTNTSFNHCKTNTVIVQNLKLKSHE